MGLPPTPTTPDRYPIWYSTCTLCRCLLVRPIPTPSGGLVGRGDNRRRRPPRRSVRRCLPRGECKIATLSPSIARIIINTYSWVVCFPYVVVAVMRFVLRNGNRLRGGLAAPPAVCPCRVRPEAGVEAARRRSRAARRLGACVSVSRSAVVRVPSVCRSWRRRRRTSLCQSGVSLQVCHARPFPRRTAIASPTLSTERPTSRRRSSRSTNSSRTCSTTSARSATPAESIRRRGRRGRPTGSGEAAA